MQSTSRVATPASTAAAATAPPPSSHASAPESGRKKREIHSRERRCGRGRTDERRHEGSADGRGRNERARLCRRERCGSHGLISHLGVTRGRGAVPPLKRRRGVLCSLSPSPSPSRPLSLSHSAGGDQRVREFLLPAAVNSCVASVSGAGGAGDRGPAAVGDPHFHRSTSTAISGVPTDRPTDQQTGRQAVPVQAPLEREE